MGRKSNAQIEAERVAALQPDIAVPPAAPLSLQETPEFKEAVSAAVTEATASISEQILERLKAVRGDGSPEASAGDKGFAEGLALAIANLNEQGVGRKKVAPDVIRHRAEQREEMTRLLIEAKANGTVPLWGLRNKIFFDEQLVEPIFIDPSSKQQRQTEIEWYGVPNEAMVPLNDVAREIHTAFMGSIGGATKKNYEKGILGVTAKGMVIKTGSKAVQPPTALGDQPKYETVGGLNVPHRHQGGRFVEKRILGTVAPPAQQTA